jgi:large subunit ribosomal protein L18
MEHVIDSEARRRGVKARIRRRMTGTTERPRLVVFRSDRHIYAQAVDDAKGHTLAAASTLDKGVSIERGGNIAAANLVGSAIAGKLKALGVENVVFDRGGYLYHGRVKALAEAAREAGLKF